MNTAHKVVIIQCSICVEHTSYSDIMDEVGKE